MLKRTPLYESHRKSGGRLIEFGGWEMPVQYTGILDEHQAVRTAAGLFDISHMGEFSVRGPQAAAFLNWTLTNDLAKIAVGRGQYNLLCREDGGTVDDLYAYRLAEQQFLLIVNASRIDADFAWMQQQLDRFPGKAEVQFANQSDAWGAIAVQGPRAVECVAPLFASAGDSMASRPGDLKKNQLGQFLFDGAPVWVARTGYSGEDGFEIVAPANQIAALWDAALAAGQPFGLKPTGLGARDTLRTEMGYPLYGHELNEQTSPIEAGLDRFVALGKTNFIGRAALAQQKASGVAKQCVAFKMTDKSAPPRPQYAIWHSGAKVGEVVSGTLSPSLGIGIGMGYVPPSIAAPGTAIEIEIRGKCAAAVIVPKPIYQKPTPNP